MKLLKPLNILMLAGLVGGSTLLFGHVVKGSQYIKSSYETINKRAEIVVIGEVVKISELLAYGDPKIEPRRITIKVATSIRGNDNRQELSFQTRKHFGLDYKIGMEGVFFLRKLENGQTALVDERGVGVFDRELSTQK